MIDIKPYIAEKLDGLAAVELAFGKAVRRLPVICVSETGNSAEVVLNNSDRISRITVQLDVYAETAAETEELAAAASGRLTAAGLRRISSQLIADEDRPRRCMRFSCGVDEAENRILALN